MSSASPSASPRPTLPSLKEMLSDVDFDKLRLRAAEDRREAANIPATTFTHSSDVGGERAQRQRRENCSWAPPSPRAPVAAHAVPHAVPHGLPYVDAPNVRFDVPSSARGNHRDAANAATHAPSYPHPYYREQQPYMLHRMNSSPASSSTMSSFSDGEDYPDSPVISPQPRVIYSPPQGRTRSASEAYPPTQGRLASRPRACTISGCNCGEEAPGALRPAFQPGSSTPRYPPTSR
ncbi:hypothetical protein ACG7TL_003353 [Trametes sanguinea]